MKRVLAFGAVAPLPAWAHHFMDGALPGSWLEGLVSGLAHPVIGLDHAAFVLGAGFLLAFFPAGLWPVLALAAGALAGAGLHLAGIVLPGAEAGVALSILGLALFLFVRRRVSWSAVAAALAVAGVFHGYAYGEAIIGAEPAPLVGYLAGFTLSQLGLACAAFFAHRALRARRVLPRQSSSKECR